MRAGIFFRTPDVPLVSFLGIFFLVLFAMLELSGDARERAPLAGTLPASTQRASGPLSQGAVALREEQPDIAARAVPLPPGSANRVTPNEAPADRAGRSQPRDAAPTASIALPPAQRRALPAPAGQEEGAEPAQVAALDEASSEAAPAPSAQSASSPSGSSAAALQSLTDGLERPPAAPLSASPPVEPSPGMPRLASLVPVESALVFLAEERRVGSATVVVPVDRLAAASGADRARATLSRPGGPVSSDEIRLEELRNRGGRWRLNVPEEEPGSTWAVVIKAGDVEMRGTVSAAPEGSGEPGAGSSPREPSPLDALRVERKRQGEQP